MTEEQKRVGLIVNPYAGMGGAVGLKGTDGDARQRAIALGAEPRSAARALVAIRMLAALAPQIECLSFSGTMGGDVVAAAGLAPRLIGTAKSEPSSADDTRTAAGLMLAQDVDLLLFAGGDGTARDIAAAVNLAVTVIGIPTGVKMHSAVFANSPAAAAALACEYVSGRMTQCTHLEVMDLDEAEYRENRISPRLFGYLRVPEAPRLIQGPKVPVASERANVSGIAQRIVEEMDAATAYLIGPGTTTKAILERLGLEHTLVGVDVVRDRQLLALDASGPVLQELTRRGPVKIVVTAIGGQGFLFGRGNQQIGAEIVARAGVANVIVVASPAKLASLQGRPLRVDLDNADVEAEFPKYLNVTTGYAESTIYPVSTA